MVSKKPVCMSSGLMSCVRENSPPLELDMNASEGPLSLPEVNTSGTNMATSTPVKETTIAAHSNTTGSGSAEGTKAEPSNATPNAEQQKRRRFHPLRNLRRIFRRRTITSTADTTAATTVAATTAASSATPGSSNTLPPPASSSSEKNLRSAGLSTAISSTVTTSASSPSSPLTHQQLQDSYQTQSLPKSKSYGSHRDELLSVILGKKKRSKNEKSENQKYHKSKQQQQQVDLLPDVVHDNSDMYSATSTATSSPYHQRFQQQSQQPQSRQSLGIAVFPSAMSRSFFTERSQNLRSVGDLSQDLDSSGNESGGGHHTTNTTGGHHLMNASTSNANGEMTDSQRSLSEGRLLDSDFTRDPLSQSHDSVFSESATASSLSIVLKAELADVLRKRRNRPDASDEDLGLPRSPASPQRRGLGATAGMRSTGGALSNMTSTPPNTTAGDVSSLSLLSMNSTDGEESGIHEERRYNGTRVSTSSSFSMSSSDILRPHHHEQLDEVDRVSSERQRLSHSAAKHKMAIRPVKKNVPTRQHRRTLETSIPEANEDSPKVIGGSQQAKKGYDNDVKTKTRSLPPIGKVEDLPGDVPSGITTSNTTSNKRSKTVELTTVSTSNSSNSTTTAKKETVAIKETSSTSHHSFGLRALTTRATALFDNRESSTDDGIPESNDSGFLRRLMHRNSKRTIAKVSGAEEDTESIQSEPKKLQISTSCMDASNREPLLLPNKSRSATSYEQNIEETRKLIKREISNEGKSGLNAMLNNFSLTTIQHNTTSPHRPEQPSQSSKPKSGPAARQRYLPQELSSPGSTLERKNSTDNFNGEEVISVTNLLAKTSRGNDTFQSTSMVREITAAQQSQTQLQSSTSPTKMDSHFEKKAKIVGLSAFQQKLTRSNESVGHNSNSSNSLETSTDEPSPLYYAEKQRKTVEKSRSFRNYQDERDSINGNSSGVHNNMPSLPDLSLSFRVPVSYYNDFMMKKEQLKSPTSPTEKCVSLGFEINDNKLIKSSNTPRAESTGQLKQEKNVIMTTTNNKKSTPTKLGGMMPAISPRNSANISEIEENIDLIVKSPFVSVLRKTNNTEDEQELTSSNSSLKSPTKVLVTEQKLEKIPVQQHKEHKQRPKVLELKQSTINNMRPSETPKSVKSTSTTAINMTSNKIIITTEPERKSAPVVPTSDMGQSLKSSRHSLVDSGSSDTSDSGCGSASGSQVPEFMKIQLNRVDHARLNQTNNVVLAKNVKTERQSSVEAKPTERSYSIDNLSTRRASHDSNERFEYEEEPEIKNIMERNRQPRNPQRQTSCKQEVIGKQTRAFSANSIRTSVSSIGSNGSVEVLTPKSPVKPALPTSPMPKSPVKQTKTPLGSPTKVVDAAVASPLVTLRTSTEMVLTSKAEQNNKISLEERRRLFLNEDKSKSERKVEELRMERKKSINEELFRKSITHSVNEIKDLPMPTTNDNSNNSNNSTSPTATTNTLETANTVVLRKKSFAVGTQHAHSFNGNSVQANPGINQDGTPELMKVFARRSLKIKDEDGPILPTVNTNTAANPIKKLATNYNQPTQSVDSDKENQSASEEKLDKLTKYETKSSIEVVTQNNNNNNINKLSHSGNRNSLADFRNSGGSLGSNALSHAHGNNNNNNNNNSNTNVNNSNNSGSTSIIGNGVGVQVGNNCTKSYLPPIKISNLRHANNINNNNETSNNNINNNMTSNHTKMGSTERFSLQLKRESTSTTSTPTVAAVASEAVDNDINPTNNIERSATVGEFKGIHQRRAEWEQRAKEALK